MPTSGSDGLPGAFLVFGEALANILVGLRGRSIRAPLAPDDRMVATLLIPALLIGSSASAQTLFRQDESLKPDRPEVWAMNYVASSLMTAAGKTPALGTWNWMGALDLGGIPRLSKAQRRVGFNGTELEDLSKSPVFGRLRVGLGLPAGWVGEIGYSPPVSIDGARPSDLVAVAIGRRVIEHDRTTNPANRGAFCCLRSGRIPTNPGASCEDWGCKWGYKLVRSSRRAEGRE